MAVGATTATGNFVLPDLAPGNDYVLEVLSAGAVVGTSRMVTVTAGKAASVWLTALGEAPMSPTAPAPPRRAGVSTALVVGGVVAAAGVALGIAAASGAFSNASPSR